ncbi:anhydro-N-acetylmuramic acid kinase [uncultured Tenacibaculum sp.]|uniref:anhydro-N-acetylmuramic acid kinase n=1 Tax=uncultured Tenacibaculum sp. TaxID=174713 RepID=UPI00263277BB|nr:anhydro-N-acetylmuramic acid kinase [uncultured Tenacibaculum sp.]
MQNEFRYAIGLMSGTSLDGLDLVYVKFNNFDYKDFQIIHAETKAYNTNLKSILSNAIRLNKKKLQEVNDDYGVYLGKCVNEFIEKFNIETVDFIASHGHTVFHQPDKGITLQIGNGEKIAEETNIQVVYDFRTQDVNLGGQGAPLVPIGDKLLFNEYDFCVNLGGFANVSFENDKERIAFDICPVNIVLNFYVRKLGFDYDNNGKIASKGKINSDLLNKLNALDFYKKIPPKSLGLEWVQEKVFPLIDDLEKDIPTILKTFVKHSAIQISKVIKSSNRVLITGGGVYNTFLIQEIENITQTKIHLASKNLIEYKEALIFAFLGLLKLNGEVNCLKSVTGASEDHSSGVVFPIN